MKEKLEKLKEEALLAINHSSNEEDIENIKAKFLGKKSEFNKIMSDMCILSPEEKKEVGAYSSIYRAEVNSAIENKTKSLKEKELEDRLSSDMIDITLPSTKVITGSKHPVSAVVEEIENIFVSMGYVVYDRPTFDNETPIIDSCIGVLIKKIKLNENKKPFKLLSSGRVPSENNPYFTCVEGITASENISIANLKGTMELLVKKLFGTDKEVYLEPSYSRFSKLSFKVKMSCSCTNGCDKCNNSGSVYSFDSGIVTSDELSEYGFDNFSGFTFNINVEKLAMIKYSIDNINLLYTNDIRFLENFEREELKDEA